MVTEYQASRRERMNEYLNSLKEEAKRINGDESVVFLAQDFLTLLTHKLAQRNLVLEVPDCCSNEGCDGELNIMFTWTKNEHFLESEVFEGMNYFGFCYKNLLTKEHLVKAGGDEYVESFYFDRMLEKLSLFVE